MKEENVWRKPWNGDALKIALVYPNHYSAMAGLTVQTLYSLWNNSPQVICERFFLPESHKPLPQGNRIAPVRSIENSMPLAEFDIIAFTLSYELDYPHICWFLDNALIPFKRQDRAIIAEPQARKDSKSQENMPIVIAGGAAVRSNPLPLEQFLDAVFIGEIEPVNEQFFQEWFEAAQDIENLTYKSIQAKFLHNIAKLEGFWVPAIKTLSLGGECVDRAYSHELDKIPHPIAQTHPILPPRIPSDTLESFPSNMAFTDSFFIEVARGCPHFCRFCMTGAQIKPYRFRSLANLQSIILQGKEQTIFTKIALIGSSVTDHPDFLAMCRFILEQGLEFSVPSIRVDRLTLEMAQLLQQGGMKTVTIAPEAGSDSLRKRINKHITNSQILHGAQILHDVGIRSLKLYLLVGLPSETEDDIDALIELVREICEIGFGKHAIKLSINPFIPKAHTPFEVAYGNYSDPAMPLLKQRIKRIKDTFRGHKQVKVNSLPLWEAYLQLLFALGDRSFGNLVLRCYKEGMKQKQWFTLLSKAKYGFQDRIQAYFFSLQNKSFGNRPWNLIRQGLLPTRLQKHWDQANKQ
ncbi:MAG: radical SAM protein [Promethearchaeota archaeon]